MAKVQKRTFSLTPAQGEFLDRKVASGEYASGSEVIRNGLRDMMEHDAALERWLREEVVPTYDAYKADPSRARPVDEVFDELEAELDEKIAQRKRA